MSWFPCFSHWKQLKRIESWGVDEFDWKEEKWDALKGW